MLWEKYVDRAQGFKQKSTGASIITNNSEFPIESVVKTARVPGITYDGTGETRNMMNELSLSYSAPIDINFIAACLCPEKYSAKVPATIWVPTN